jgi:hypothetical protein
MLRINGIALTENAFVEALKHPVGVIQSAAAHTIGSIDDRAAAPELIKLLSHYDDVVKTEAAFALARMGFAEGVSALHEVLGYSIEGSVSPPIAAGYLAQLGEKQGFPVIEKSMASTNELVRMVGCKQIFFFARFEGEARSGDHAIDVMALFAQALADPAPDAAWQALVQLKELRLPKSKIILEAFIQTSHDPQLREMATQIANSLDQE